MLVGFAALSVDINVKLQLHFIEHSNNVNVPKILLLIAAAILFSRIFTCLYAAA